MKMEKFYFHFKIEHSVLQCTISSNFLTCIHMVIWHYYARGRPTNFLFFHVCY